MLSAASPSVLLDTYVVLAVLQVAIVFALLVAAVRCRLLEATAFHAIDRANAARSATAPSPRDLLRLAEALARSTIAVHPSRRGAPLAPPVAAALRPYAASLLEAITRSRRHHGRARNRVLGLLAILGRAPHAGNLKSLLASLLVEDADVKAHAARALGAHPVEYPAAAVALADEVGRATGLERVTLLWALRRLLAAHPGLFGALRAHAAPGVRRLAVSGLPALLPLPGIESKEAAIVPLTDALTDPDDSVRETACLALGQLGTDLVTVHLSHQLGQGSKRTQQASASALAALGTPSARLLLASRLLTAKAELATHLLRSLGRAGAPAPRQLADWLSSDDPGETYVALRCLTVLPITDGALAPALVTRLAHANPTLRSEAARACGAALRESPALIPLLAHGLLSRLHGENDEQVLGSLGHAIACAADPALVNALVARVATAGRLGRETLLESVALLEFLKAHVAPAPSRP